MKNKKTILIVGILLVISLIYTYFTTEMHKIDPEEISENLSVTYLDVGQGDSILLGCAPENRDAEHIYRKLGFIPTGVVEHGEAEFRLML